MVILWRFILLLLILQTARSSSSDPQSQPSPQKPTSSDSTAEKTLAPNKPTVVPKDYLVIRRNDLDLNEGVFPTCNPTCMNGGVCRLNTNDNKPWCLCTMNYTGSTCEQSAYEALKTCQESTCRNGGSCTGTTEKPVCSCLEGTSGIKCEFRSRIYEVLLKLLYGGVPIQWNASFANSSDPVYLNTAKELIRILHLAALLGDDKLLVRAYKEVQFNKFFNGSVTASVYVKFQMDDTQAKPYTDQKVTDHLASGGRRLVESAPPASFRNLASFERTDANLFFAKVANPCTLGNHDCSANAVCIPATGGVYTCECKTFTMDVSPNGLYPGRHCIYDGLIILTFVVIGCLLSMLIFVLCGCRRTIWYRYRNRNAPEHVTLVKMAADYDI